MNTGKSSILVWILLTAIVIGLLLSRKMGNVSHDANITKVNATYAANVHHDININNVNSDIINSAVNVIDSAVAGQDDSKCVRLAKLRPTVQICVHDSTDDIYVSKSIIEGGFWESDHVTYIMKMLHHDQGLHVIDVGANIGQYTLIGAPLGRQVVAVEARLKHVQMIHNAVVLNGFQKQVTIVHNAVSDRREAVKLGFYPDNQGGTYVKANGEDGGVTKQSGDNSLDAQSILLDDITPVVNFSKAILKIDIETYECKALSHADALFDKVYIPYIFMEWMGIRKKPEVAQLILWLQKRQYEPFVIGNGHIDILELNSAHTTWPNDVYLKKKSEDARILLR